MFDLAGNTLERHTVDKTMEDFMQIVRALAKSFSEVKIVAPPPIRRRFNGFNEKAATLTRRMAGYAKFRNFLFLTQFHKELIRNDFVHYRHNDPRHLTRSIDVPQGQPCGIDYLAASYRRIIQFLLPLQPLKLAPLLL